MINNSTVDVEDLGKIRHVSALLNMRHEWITISSSHRHATNYCERIFLPMAYRTIAKVEDSGKNYDACASLRNYCRINMCPKKILFVVDINTWQINAKAKYFYWQQITTEVRYFHPRISAKSFCRKVKKIQMGVLFIHAHEQ
jgi:hypothetical protein